MTNFFAWLPARWLAVLLALLASAGPALAQTVTLPTVVTVAPVTSTIAEDQAPLGGNVTSDGGAPAGTLSAGVVYGPNGSVPTLNMSGSIPVYISSGVGSYSRLVSGLTASTTYAFRAFATNSAGTSYGAVRYFATRPVTPSVLVQVIGGNPNVSASITSSTPTYVAVVNSTSYSKDLVTLYVAPTGGSATPLSASIATGTGTGYPLNSYAAVQSPPLADGTYTIYATATNNWSGASGTSGTIISNAGPTDTKTFTVDGTAPTVTSITSTAVTSGSTVNSTAAIPFTVTFSEKVTLTTTTTVTATNGTVSALSLNSTGTTLTFSVTPTAAGSITLTLPAGAVRDLVGNPNATASPFSFTYALPVPPTVVTNPASSITESKANLGGNVTSDGGAPVTARGVVFFTSTGGGTTSQTIPMGIGMGNYGQDVTGLNSNRSYAFQAFATNSAGTSYGTVTGFTTIADAPVLFVVSSNSLQGSTLFNTRTPTYQGQTGTSTNVTIYVGTTVANAVSVGVAPYSPNPGTGLSFSLVQPAGTPLADGTYIAYAKATNSSGSSGSSNVVTFTIDATPPTPTISSTASSNTSTTPIPFTVTFSESVTGFAASDVTVTNGTLISSSFSGGGTTYSFNVTPTTAGTATTVSIAANVAQDAAGNGNVAASAFGVTYAPPSPPVVTTNPASVVTETTATLGGNVTSDGGSTVTARGVVYMPVTSLTPPVLGASGVFSSTAFTAGTGSYSILISPGTGGGLQPGVAYVFRAYATNGQGTSYGPVAYFTTIPLPPIVSFPANGSLLNTRTPTYAGTAPALFGSIVTVYVAAGNGAAQPIGTSSVSSTGSPTVYGNFSVSQPLNAPLADGTYRAYATIAASATSDNSGLSNIVTFTIDAAPTTTISSTAGTSGSSTLTSPIPFTVTFSESVTGFTASKVTVSNGTLSGFSGSGTTYSFNVTPTTAGTATTVNVAAGAAQDAGGQNNVAASPYSLTYTLAATLTTWTGTTSTDWYTATNWTAGVPTSTLDALIPVVSTGTYPLIGTGTAAAQTLTLNTGATLTHTGGTLALTSSLVNNGTFTATGGLVSLNGNSSQSVGGASTTRFWDLTVGSATATLGGAAEIQRVLTLTGSLATRGNTFTLLSSATATAMVVNNGGSVTGTTTVQRYLSPSLNTGLGYRHYSSPVQSTTVADLATSTFTPVVNASYNSQGNTIAPFPTVFGYNEARIVSTNATTQSFDQGYFSPATLADPLVSGRGYTVNLDAASKVDLMGTLTTGTVAVGALTRGTEVNSGWHLLGNPYPAPLDWNVARLSLPTGVIDAVYVFKSSSQYAGTYQFYQNGIGTLPSGLIGSMQGFFVRVSQPVSAFSFLDAWRSATYQNPTVNRTTTDPRPSVQLDLVSAQGEHDAAFVYFEQGATNGVDDHYDAEKLSNTTGLNLSSVVAGTNLAVNGYPVLGTAQRIVPLTVGVPAPGTCTLTAAHLLNLASVPVYLHDVQTGALVDLAQQPSYSFSVSNASAPLTGRFELVFSPLQALATVPAALAQQVALYPNPAQKLVFVELPASLGSQAVTAVLVDALGRQVRTSLLPAQGTLAHQLNLAELAPGVYALRLGTSAGVVVRKLVLE